MDEKYTRFKNTLRADVKLRISLEEYVKTNEEEKDSRIMQEYREYLSKRRRSAWEILIREENLDGLRLFEKEGWLTQENAEECLKMASKIGKKESQMWLLSYIKGTGKSNAYVNQQEKPVERTQYIREILEVITVKLQADIPAFASAFPGLFYQEASKTDSKETVWGTDGKYLYYSSDELMWDFLQGTEYLARKYLHTAFHCLYLHVIPSKTVSGDFDEIWNLACDIAVECALDESQWYPLKAERKKRRSVWYRMILKEEKGRDTVSCYRWLKKQKVEKPEFLSELKEEFTTDCHKYWYQEKKENHTLQSREEMVKTWGIARKGISMGLQGFGQQPGKQGGTGLQEYQSVHKKAYDYRKFLRQFAVCREEMQLDMDNFDFIPYLYGLEQYGNMLLVEPLETTEVNRLEEFVIAIDTSGSCSGEIVCRFLDETWQILSSRENFFRKMNVHIIQCDSMIQDHRKVTCEEDWKEYMKNVKIQGLGGTDFTPVFRLIDDMLEKKEIQNLKGLLYFTDGDGIFPHKKPAYETAFVFLNRELEKSKIPDWAIRLNLELRQ